MWPTWRLTWFSSRTPLPPSRSRPRRSPAWVRNAQTRDRSRPPSTPAQSDTRTGSPAGQIVESVCHLRELGATVSTAVCVIDRETGGAANLADVSVELRSYLRSTVCGAQRQARREPAGDTAASSPKQQPHAHCWFKRQAAARAGQQTATGAPAHQTQHDALPMHIRGSPPCWPSPACGDKRVSDQRPDACFHGRLLYRPHARFASRLPSRAARSRLCCRPIGSVAPASARLLLGRRLAFGSALRWGQGSRSCLARLIAAGAIAVGSQ
jgi:hypothetical protein